MQAANHALVMRYYQEVINQRDLRVLADLLGTPANGAKPDFFNETRDICAHFAQAFPDYTVNVSQWIVSDQHVVARWQAQGTQHGPFMGQPATHRRIFTSGIDIFTLANGKIIDIWQEMNMLGLLQQLGWMPALEQPLEDAKGPPP